MISFDPLTYYKVIRSLWRNFLIHAQYFWIWISLRYLLVKLLLPLYVEGNFHRYPSPHSANDYIFTRRCSSTMESCTRKKKEQSQKKCATRIKRTKKNNSTKLFFTSSEQNLSLSWHIQCIFFRDLLTIVLTSSPSNTYIIFSTKTLQVWVQPGMS